MYDISVNINKESVTVAIRETGKVSRSKGGSLFAIWENFTLYIAIKNTKNTKVSNSKNQVDAKMIVQEKSKVEWPFVALLIIFVMMTCIGRVIKL